MRSIPEHGCEFVLVGLEALGIPDLERIALASEDHRFLQIDLGAKVFGQHKSARGIKLDRDRPGLKKELEKFSFIRRPSQSGDRIVNLLNCLFGVALQAFETIVTIDNCQSGGLIRIILSAPSGRDLPLVDDPTIVGGNRNALL